MVMDLSNATDLMTHQAKQRNHKLVSLDDQIQKHGWRQIPKSFVSREGHLIEVKEATWFFATTRDVHRCNFDRITNKRLRWSLMRRVMHCAETLSVHSAVALYYDFSMEVLSRVDQFDLNEFCPDDVFQERLVALINQAISDARNKTRLWALYRVIRWYVWSAANFPEAGFSLKFAAILDGMVIPGNPKGEAVREEDPDEGPFDMSLELPLIEKALWNDTSQKFEHLQEKAAVVLSLAFGRNPANLVFLNEEDLKNLTEGICGVDPCYQLAIPRIKKRQVDPRKNFKVETLEAPLAGHLIALIKANPTGKPKVNTDQGILEADYRPLFRRRRSNSKAVPIALVHRSGRPMQSFINELLKSFVKRHEISSPLTSSLIVVNARRFRRTLATSLVDAGISRSGLARVLDHSDTQHVQVYFDIKSRVIRHLEAAQAKQFGTYLGLFKGRLINSPEEAETFGRDDKDLFFSSEENPAEIVDIGMCGTHDLCALDPPFSCYLCPKFRPYRHADHGRVLEILLNEREVRFEKYEGFRLGIQLDDVIFAVGQAVAQCEEKESA